MLSSPALCRQRRGDSSVYIVHGTLYQHYRNFRCFCAGAARSVILPARRTSGDVSVKFRSSRISRGETPIVPSDLRCFIIHAPSSQTEICLSSPRRFGGTTPLKRGRRNARSFVCVLCNGGSAEVARCCSVKDGRKGGMYGYPLD